jgi:hypothetical protein
VVLFVNVYAKGGEKMGRTYDCGELDGSFEDLGKGTNNGRTRGVVLLRVGGRGVAYHQKDGVRNWDHNMS